MPTLEDSNRQLKHALGRSAAQAKKQLNTKVTAQVDKAKVKHSSLPFIGQPSNQGRKFGKFGKFGKLTFTYINTRE
jgi:hypothetical protein